MRHAWLWALVLFLPGCATTPTRNPAAEPWFDWPEWTAISFALLDLTGSDGVITSSARAGQANARPPNATAKPTSSPGTTPSTQAPPTAKADTEYFEIGKSVELAVRADGSPPLFFQWRKNGQIIAGATRPLFTIEKASALDAGNYDCVVMNSEGSQASQMIKLVVRDP